MTREEVKKRIAGDPEAERITSKHNDFIIDKVFDYFEQRIAELEQQNKAWVDMVEMQSNNIKELEAPKTCDGCKWLNYANSRHIGGCSKINSCVRQPMISDYYEPKQ